MSTKAKVVTIVVVTGLALGVLFYGGIYYLFFYMRITAQVDSVSPDGMYMCEVTERANDSHSAGRVVLYQRVSPRGSGWEVVHSAGIYNDSDRRSNYTIDWEYNDKRRSTKVIVFGDFGGPPFEGEIVYEHSLDPNATLGGKR